MGIDGTHYAGAAGLGDVQKDERPLTLLKGLRRTHGRHLFRDRCRRPDQGCLEALNADLDRRTGLNRNVEDVLETRRWREAVAYQIRPIVIAARLSDKIPVDSDVDLRRDVINDRPAVNEMRREIVEVATPNRVSFVLQVDLQQCVINRLFHN